MIVFLRMSSSSSSTSTPSIKQQQFYHFWFWHWSLSLSLSLSLTFLLILLVCSNEQQPYVVVPYPVVPIEANMNHNIPQHQAQKKAQKKAHPHLQNSTTMRRMSNETVTSGYQDSFRRMAITTSNTNRNVDINIDINTNTNRNTEEDRNGKDYNDKIISALPWGDINVLVITDDHSWLGGHSTKNEYGANCDYGTILSFYEQLKEFCNKPNINHDLWFVMNGDWIDGTGLSMNGNVQYLVPLLQRMPYDAITVGNHELYKRNAIQQMLNPAGIIDWWGDRYISSNVRRRFSSNNVTTSSSSKSNGSGSGNSHTEEQDHEQSFGEYYKILIGKNSRLLTFGFLYNMEDYDTEYIYVQKVETVIKEKWFRYVLQNEQYDAIMILAHMGSRDTLVPILVNAIRSNVKEQNKDIAIQVITGHTHIRDSYMIDSLSSSFEAGKYLDTIGFVSFPKHSVIKWKQSMDAMHAGMSQNQSTTPIPTPTPTTMPTTTATTSETVETTSPSPLASSTIALSTAVPTSQSTPITTTGTTHVGRIVKKSTSSVQSITINYNDTTQYESFFKYMYITAKVADMENVLLHTIGSSNISTPNGIELSQFVSRVRTELGLLDVVGCINDTNETYYINRSLYEHDSLWRLFRDELVPTVLSLSSRKSTTTWKSSLQPHHVLMLDKGSWRYELYPGEISVDDVYGVSPFNDTLLVWDNIPGSVIVRLNMTLNNGTTGDYLPALPSYILATSSQSMELLMDIRNRTTDICNWNNTAISGTNASNDTTNTNYSSKGDDTISPVDNETNYSLVVSAITSKIFIQYIKELYPNWTQIPGRPLYYKYGNNTHNNNSNESSFVMTTTTIWMDFITERYPPPCRKGGWFHYGSNWGSGGGGGDTSTTPSHSNNKHSNTHKPPQQEQQGSGGVDDNTLIALSSFAIVLVFVTFAILVHQNDRRYHMATAAHEHIVFSAHSEFYNSNNYHDDHDEDNSSYDNDDSDRDNDNKIRNNHTIVNSNGTSTTMFRRRNENDATDEGDEDDFINGLF